jgi:hypothetical protein
LRNPIACASLYFGGMLEAHVHMVGHRVIFHQLDPSLTTQLAQDQPKLTPQSSSEEHYFLRTLASSQALWTH